MRLKDLTFPYLDLAFSIIQLRVNDNFLPQATILVSLSLTLTRCISNSILNF